MANEQKQPNQSTADRVFSTLAQLIATNPDAAQEVSDVMLYIRSLESKCRERAPQENFRLSGQQNHNFDESVTYAYAPVRKQTPHTYQWTNTALREHPHGEARSHLQVSLEDYKDVVKAICQCSNKYNLITAAEIGDAAATIAGRKIPPTQMYLCIRYLRSEHLIERAGGRKLRVTSDLREKFNERAEDLIDPQ